MQHDIVESFDISAAFYIPYHKAAEEVFCFLIHTIGIIL